VAVRLKVLEWINIRGSGNGRKELNLFSELMYQDIPALKVGLIPTSFLKK
jgi:hypothetical protein